jgi:hypothetical protein
MSEPKGFDPTTLTDSELTECIFEMRRRGAAVTVYDVDEIMTMTDGWDGQPTREQVEAWFDKDDMESAMSGVVHEKINWFFEDLEGIT